MSIYTEDVFKKLMFYDGTTEISKYVVPESFKKQEYLCSGQLNFGEVNSTKIQFKTYGNLSLTGKVISVRFGTDSENEQIGTYKATYSSTKSNSSIVTVTAYDSMKAFDRDVSDWYVSLPWPLKLKKLRKSLCEYVGIAAVETELINDDIMLYKTVNPSSLNGMEMLFYIGQLNGVFAHAAGNYSMEWVNLDTDVFEIAKSVTYDPTAFEAKSYDTAPIGGIVIRQEDGDIGVSIGTTNKYVIQGNILIYGYSTVELTPVANRLYDKIKDIRYVPCSLKLKYLPDIKMGSKCSYDGNVFYVLQRSTSGLLFDTLTAGGNEYLESDTGIESQLEQLRGKANILKQSIEETKNTISDIEQGLKNEITMNASEFDAKLQNLQSQVDGTIEVIYGHGQPTLENYPAYNWTAGPKIGDTLVEGLCFTYSDEAYRKHQRTLFYDEDEAVTYRFIQRDGIWVWEPLANTEFSMLQKQITDLNLTAQGITADVESLSTLITNDYITEVDARTLASVTADGIMADVSKTYARDDVVQKMQLTIKATADEMDLKVEKDKLIAEINAKAGKVKISADAVDLAGLVTISSLQKSGETVINADNITTGTIKALLLAGCTMEGGAISIGGNNIIMNEKGLWVIGECAADKPAYMISNQGEISQYWTDGIRRFYTNGLSVSGTWVTHFDEYTASSNWYQICIAANNTSDAREKNTINSLDDEENMNQLFDCLKPSAFYYNKGSGYIETQRHMGFIAQDVSDAIKQAGIKCDMALFDHFNEDKLGVNKQELIALCVWQIQKLKKRVSELENNIGGGAA